MLLPGMLVENVPEPQGPRDAEVTSLFLAVPHPCPSGKLEGCPQATWGLQLSCGAHGVSQVQGPASLQVL